MNKKYRLNKFLFNEIFHSSKYSYSENFLIKFKRNDSQKRVGISISKKNFKKSIIRNKIKRQIRSMIYPIIDDIKNFDLIIIVKKKYNICMYKDLKIELISLLVKNKILN